MKTYQQFALRVFYIRHCIANSVVSGPRTGGRENLGMDLSPATSDSFYDPFFKGLRKLGSDICCLGRIFEYRIDETSGVIA